MLMITGGLIMVLGTVLVALEKSYGFAMCALALVIISKAS